MNNASVSVTIASLLSTATGKLTAHTDSARLDAELLLCHCLDKPRTYLYTWPEQEVGESQRTTFNSLINRRIKGEPVAYITGVREFWSQSFMVTPDTLIPRADTEILVEQSLLKLQDKSGAFLDLGTGSGIIAICIATERPDINVTATDRSKAALTVARSNATKLNARVRFVQSNWLQDLVPQKFTVIAANPPYIAADDPHLKQTGLPYEPISALRSCDDGYADITAIINTAKPFIEPLGWLLLEHGNSQSQRTRALMSDQNFNNVSTVQDLAGNDRVTLGQLA